MTYNIDGKDSRNLLLTITNPGLHLVTEAAALVTLPQLTDGPHTLTLCLYGKSQTSFDTVNFTVDSTPPKITMLSPKNNATYTAADIPLNFTLNEQRATITCILDGNQTALPAENTTLTGLSVGEHSLIVTAKDAAGNAGNSQTIQFTITTPTPSPTPQPAQLTLISEAAIVGVLVAGVVVIFGGIFAYRGGRKTKVGCIKNS